ncbi:MAG TPA: sulfite exporter TauE/SafE family protein [Rhizomicrobium sp.]|jgi:uncharacterized membrane protein YfcA
MALFAGTSPGDLAVLGAGLVVSGVAGGLVAGMLGVGGGIVIVPILYHVLALIGVDESVRMHVAVGTSLATIIPTSFSSVRAHNAKGAVDWDLLRRWAAPMVVGVLIGSALAGIASGRALSLVFVCVALPVSLHLAFGGEDRRLADHLPGGIGGLAIPTFIGGISTMMGIGGGTVGVPAMTLCGVPIHRAVGTASAFGVLISIPGTIGMIANGWTAHGLPAWSLGYVNLLGFLLIAPASFFMAPVGANLAHSLDKRRLRLFFAAFIAVTAARMIWDALL